MIPWKTINISTYQHLTFYLLGIIASSFAFFLWPRAFWSRCSLSILSLEICFLYAYIAQQSALLPWSIWSYSPIFLSSFFHSFIYRRYISPNTVCHHDFQHSISFNTPNNFGTENSAFTRQILTICPLWNSVYMLLISSACINLIHHEYCYYY